MRLIDLGRCLELGTGGAVGLAALAPLFGFGDEIVVSHLVLGVEHRKHRTIFVSAGSTWQSLTLLLATAIAR